MSSASEAGEVVEGDLVEGDRREVEVGEGEQRGVLLGDHVHQHLLHHVGRHPRRHELLHDLAKELGLVRGYVYERLVHHGDVGDELDDLLVAVLGRAHQLEVAPLVLLVRLRIRQSRRSQKSRVKEEETAALLRK